VTRIVQVANFFGPRSGGLRTALNALAAGYADAGHEVVQVVPGPAEVVEEQPWGARVVRRGREVPGTGYRVLRGPGVARTLDQLAPDRLEVHDRTTLRGLGRWASARGVPSLTVSHERLDRWLAQWLPPTLPLGRMADRANAATAASFDAVVCTTAWAAEEFERLGVGNLVRVPLGVDLELFSPRVTDSQLRGELAEPHEQLLVMASRLSREKCPQLAVAAAERLAADGVPVRLAVAGDGPLRRSLTRRAQDLPVTFLGFVPGRGAMARLLATADVVVAPGPVETFGLAALEALASGTPVVASVHSALGEVLGPDAPLAGATGADFARAVRAVLERAPAERRPAARRRAEQFPWSATVEGFLAVHRLQPARATRGAA
jgi:alpha-1,6-mannosyltransferase